MNKTRIASSFLLLVFVSTPPAYGHAVVDCDAGDSIQAELDAGETEVEFTGACNEFVTITNDKTVIRGGSGNPSFDRITEGLSVEGADGVIIRDAGIQGSHVGLVDGSHVTMAGSRISVDLGSVFRYGGDVVGLTRSQVRGSIRISRDSAFVTDSRGLHVTGDIVCADEESSFSGPVDGPAGIACSEF